MFSQQQSVASVSTPVITAAQVFSPYVYTGTATAQTINNGVDTTFNTGKALIWTKPRLFSGLGNNYNYHWFYDDLLYSDMSQSWYLPGYGYQYVTAVNTHPTLSNSGYILGSDDFKTNTSGQSYVSWTFKATPKFFDMVTWNGSGSARLISHSLGSVPKCIIVVRTDASSPNAPVMYHSALPSFSFLAFGGNSAPVSDSTVFAATPTATSFTIGTGARVNLSGVRYKAYLFASDAGGFGLGATENIVKCFSYTGTGAAQIIDCGFTNGARFLMAKRTDITSDWFIFDTARGMTDSASPYLANSIAPEVASAGVSTHPSGFQFSVANPASTTINIAGAPYVGIAIA